MNEFSVPSSDNSTSFQSLLYFRFAFSQWFLRIFYLFHSIDNQKCECVCVCLYNRPMNNKYATWKLKVLDLNVVIHARTHARWVECVLFIIMCAHICERTILLFTKIGSHLLLWNGENENEKKQRDIQTICTVNKSFCTFAHKGADTSAIHLRQWRQKKFNQFQEHNEREQEQGKRFSSCAFDLHIFCVCKMSNLNGMTCMCVWVYQWDGVW